MQSLAGRLKLLLTRIKSDYNMASLGIAVFTLYAITQRLLDLYTNIRFFDVTVIRVFEILLFSFSVLCLLIGRYDPQKHNKLFTNIDILWFIAISFIIISMYHNNFDRYDYFVYLTLIVFLYFAKTEVENFNTAFLLIKYSAIFYATGTLLQFFLPEFFNTFILNFTTKISLNELEQRVNANYYPGFGFDQIALAANYISIGLGLILAFWDNKKAKIFKDLIIFIVLLAALFITGKRSFMLWTIVALYFTYIATGLGSDRKWRIIKASAAVFGLAVLAFVIVRYFGYVPLFARLQLLFNEIFEQGVSGSLAVRFLLYRDAWALFLSNPWFGIGWDQFRVVHETGFRVHNVFIQLLAETGIVGFLLIVSPIIYTYQKTYEALRTSLCQVDSINPIWSKALALSFYYQTVFLLNGLSDTLFYRMPYLLMYFLILSIANSYIYLHRNFDSG